MKTFRLLLILLACPPGAIAQLPFNEPPCVGCLPSFNPMPGERYVINAWVRLADAPSGTIHYGAPTSAGPHALRIDVEAGGNIAICQAIPVGNVIDDWQLMEGVFTMPFSESDITITLVCEEGSAYFDDIRVFPADGSMKCYVYDPLDLRFVAELDERHYATFYEYDNEGKLVRIKKETERGRTTIQQTQYNTHHAP